MTLRLSLFSIGASLCLSVGAQTVLTDAQLTEAYNATFNNATPNYVTVHDPSVVIGYEGSDGKVTANETPGSKKVYCIFGSHKAWAKSYDLQNWSYFSNNLSTQFATIFAEDAAWSALGSSNYDVSGNLWAPDVIWNPTMNKWCMYMSVNGDKWYSQIVLLTAESLTGNWTRVGTVVYSGFLSNNANKTDLYDILGTNEYPSRYTLNRNGNRTYGMNAIDPCTFFDEDGTMWMVYGSWFGGLYTLKLDPATGLRDKTYTYTTTDGTAEGAISDAYQGLKLAGGNHKSGEAPYIEYYNGKYYLFVTYGGLTANGGYNMRVFTSDKATGPFVDISGQDARYASNNTTVGDVNGYVGTRLMSYYRWGFMNYGYTAQGHNSAVVDTDGRMFLVYHTRFDDGTEGHQVRVHQLFQTKSKYLTTTPFQYRGETIDNKAYTTEELVGKYGVLSHTPTNYASLQCVTEKTFQLNADGTVSGGFSGTWSLDADGPYINMKLGTSTTYEGIIIEQYIENTNQKALCISLVSSNDCSLWGYKRTESGNTFSDEVMLAIDSKTISIPSSASSGMKLSFPTTTDNGLPIAWTTSNETIISSTGEVGTVSADTKVDITYTITCGDYSYSKTQSVSVSTEKDFLEYYADETTFAAAKPTDLITETTGLSISFDINGLTSDWDKVAHSTDNSKYILYLSVLHYNNNDHYEAVATQSAEAKATGLAPHELFLNGSYNATVSFNTDGSISYYRNGVLMLTYAANASSSYPSGGTVKPADIVKAVVNYYKKDQLVFDRSVSNIKINYAKDYVPSESAITDVNINNISIINTGKCINIANKLSSDIVRVYDIMGKIIYEGYYETIEIAQNGFYIVTVNNISKRILICRK